MSPTVEYGYRPVPESTGNISGNRIERLAGLTYTEPLPRECIVYAHVYEFARELLDPSVKDLATEDALINLACLTISEYEGKQLDQAKLILTVNEWNRVVPVAYGKIPYGNRHMGYTINQKGGYISGIYMAAVDDLAVRANYPLVLQDPLGLFGLKESTIDADISRDLLASDARSSLPLGFILLHPGKLKENFEKKWQNFPELYRKLVEDIDKVVSQDSLVLSFRVGGIPDRLSKTAYDKYVDPRHKGNIGRKRAAFAWGNRLLLDESFRDPVHFSREVNNISLDNARDVLTRVSQRKSLSPHEFKLYSDVIENILVNDGIKVLNLIKQKPQYIGLSEEYINLKDICYGLIHQDYEEVLKLNYLSIPQDATLWVRHIWNEYLKLVQI